MQVSIVLPAIDETESLAETVRIAEEKLHGRTVEYRIVTSPKFTTAECRGTIATLAKTYGAKIQHMEQTRPGVGGAIQDAFDVAVGNIVVLMTSDRETPPQFVDLMVAKVEEGYDMATASRWTEGIAFNGYPPLKLLLNYVYQLVFRLIYWTKLSDLTYGYRAFRKEVVANIRWQETRHPIFFETLLRPLRAGYRVGEVSTPWKTFTTRKADARRGKTDSLASYITHIGIPYTKLALRVRFAPRESMVHHPLNDHTA
jgi:dolichol-phosphate mannosyltransferase